jgi:hypothetical protein
VVAAPPKTATAVLTPPPRAAETGPRKTGVSRSTPRKRRGSGSGKKDDGSDEGSENDDDNDDNEEGSKKE